MSDRIKHILFVCTGNICRSPFAEGLLKKLAQKNGLDDIVADSAGLLALPGNSVTGLAQKVAVETVFQVWQNICLTKKFNPQAAVLCNKNSL